MPPSISKSLRLRHSRHIKIRNNQLLAARLRSLQQPPIRPDDRRTASCGATHYRASFRFHRFDTGFCQYGCAVEDVGSGFGGVGLGETSAAWGVWLAWFDL